MFFNISHCFLTGFLPQDNMLFRCRNISLVIYHPYCSLFKLHNGDSISSWVIMLQHCLLEEISVKWIINVTSIFNFWLIIFAIIFIFIYFFYLHYLCTKVQTIPHRSLLLTKFYLYVAKHMFMRSYFLSWMWTNQSWNHNLEMNTLLKIATAQSPVSDFNVVIQTKMSCKSGSQQSQH